MKRAENILKQYFGYSSFRSNQGEIIDKIIQGRHTLAIMPTGAGKSLCYQIPALVFQGMTLVISPLLSLMKDQVQMLVENGVEADFLNSSLTKSEYFNLIGKIKEGKCKILYIAPERLESPEFLEIIKHNQVDMVAIDEAHCISQWGHDFRPSYRNIRKLVNIFENAPIIAAFTATATTAVKDDIVNELQLVNPYIKVTGFDRPNIYFNVQRNVDKSKYLLKNLSNEHSSIVYCATRNNVEEVYDMLKTRGFSVAKYHGGMDMAQRELMQNQFIYDEKRTMVATIAFGMGIDKPDVRKVIHYNMSKSLENYYQEAGRGGRDGEPAEATILYSPGDIMTQRYIIEKNNNGTEEYEQLDKMVEYCNTTQCLRTYILNYFGEKTEKKCDYCGNCSSDFVEKDITLEAQKILSCIYRAGQRFGSSIIASILNGSKSKKLLQMQLDQLSTYGIMRDFTLKTIGIYIDEMVRSGYIEKTKGQYPILSLSKKSKGVLVGEEKVIITLREEQVQATEAMEDRKIYRLTSDGIEIFEILRRWRGEKAAKEGVPPFVIASDATLQSLIQIRPKDKIELLQVHGIGEKKSEIIGEELLELLKENLAQDKTYVVASEKEKDIVKTSKAVTHIKTYKMYEKGLSVKEIAKNRNLAESTIVQHIEKAIAEGMKVNIREFVSLEHEQLIRKTITEVGGIRLKHFKENLPEEVTYGEIKIVATTMKNEKKEEYN